MQFRVNFKEIDKKLPVTFRSFQGVEVYAEVEKYTGSYEITPKVDAQTMPTAQKFMNEDVTVKAIPFFDVSNDAGGNTIFIASEV